MALIEVLIEPVAVKTTELQDVKLNTIKGTD